jgi:trk system potassium uptake protein TrkA
MRIVVLGGGTVGTSIADLLCRHGHSVTVVDNDAAHARRINNEMDVRTVCGSASQSSVLFQADILGADVCLAVTGDDEVNIVSASMAKGMGARRAIARVYGPVFRDLSTFDYQRHFNIDRMLSLEHLSAMELARGIRNPGSITLENFARGELEVQEVVIREQTKHIDVPLKSLDLFKDIRVGSIVRDNRMWIAGAEDKIQLGDRITLIGERDDVEKVKDAIQKHHGTKQGVVIAGGGETGYHLARTLENDDYAVVLMEENTERSQYLANHLSRTTVVQADATRRIILEEERVGTADYFVACTGDDENNIMAGVEARDIGAKHVMAIIGRPDYANVVGKLGIDLAVSPRDVMAKQILGFLNIGPVVSHMSLTGGDIDVYEIEVLEGALATEHVLAKVPFPPSCLIAAVMQQDYARVPRADDRLKPGDVVVALIEDSQAEEALEQFRVNGR